MEKIYVFILFLFSHGFSKSSNHYDDDAEPIVYMNGGGDSLSMGFNTVRNGLPNNQTGEPRGSCLNIDQPDRSFASVLTSTICPPPESLLVRSFAQSQFCAGGVPMNVANAARTGATMLRDWKNQAEAIANDPNFLTAKPNDRKQVILFMGHNDICGGLVDKINPSCSNTDKDPNGYCRTYVEAFEREFRNGLESLVSKPNTTIGVLAPTRVSQLCKAKDLNMCQPLLFFPNDNSCSNAWRSKIGGGNGICISLTQDCSESRIKDAYLQLKRYRDVLQSVSAEYNHLKVGESTKLFTFNGKTVGGAKKADGFNLIYSDATCTVNYN
jgi:hypothetical protein